MKVLSSRELRILRQPPWKPKTEKIGERVLLRSGLLAIESLMLIRSEVSPSLFAVMATRKISSVLPDDSLANNIS